MIKKTCIIIFIVLSTFILNACNDSITTHNTQIQGKIKVAVTFNALREFTLALGKDKVDIITIIPDGTEPHDFEPKARDLEALSTADIFVYNGLGMENWTDKSLEVIDNKKLITVDSSKGISPIKNTDSDAKDHGHYDPHIWLSLKNAENQAKNIETALETADPSNKAFYEKNYEDFSSQLNSLYQDYSKKFAETTNKSFVTGHAAFAYLCRDFNLKQNSVEDVFAEGEPSAKKMKELTDYCKQNHIKTIFVEDMVSPKVSETLAKEVGAVTKKIHTIESKDDKKDYLQCMRENLDIIYSSIQ